MVIKVVEQVGEMSHAVKQQLFILVITENRQAGIAPANHMVTGIREFDAQWSGHGVSSEKKSYHILQPYKVKIED